MTDRFRNALREAEGERQGHPSRSKAQTRLHCGWANDGDDLNDRHSYLVTYPIKI